MFWGFRSSILKKMIDVHSRGASKGFPVSMGVLMQENDVTYIWKQASRKIF